MPQAPLISPSELLQLRKHPDLVLIDTCYVPATAEGAARTLLAGARVVRLNEDLSEVPADASRGGRHPLPDITTFGRTLTRLGVAPSTHVVVYDDKNGANAAARLWWMLRAVGHEAVQVVDGGLQAALAAGYPAETVRTGPANFSVEDQNTLTDQTQAVRTEIPGSSLAHSADGDENISAHESASYPVPAWWLWPLADIAAVAEAARDPQFSVIDVRESGRYRGEFEPLDLVAGHIPGAENIPFMENLGHEGKFKSPTELANLYASANANVIVHCGSGVTACHTILAMVHAGLPAPRLYVGSWSEWSRSGRPQATVPQP
jgi:thiosulfate/3-mercaptopyruvate sulfurtransferase